MCVVTKEEAIASAKRVCKVLKKTVYVFQLGGSWTLRVDKPQIIEGELIEIEYEQKND